jgi:hypothetical protein
MSQENVELVRASFEAFERGNIARALRDRASPGRHEED